MKTYASMTDREKVRFLEEVMDAISDLVLVKADSSRLVWANKAFRDCYGMSQVELRGILDAPHSDPDHTLQYVQDDAWVFENQRSLNIPSEPVTRHDSTIRHYNTIKSPMLNSEGATL